MCTMAKRILKSVSEVVDALGGPSALGARFNIGQSAVSNWNMRGEIPTGWHLRIYLSVKEMGLDIDPEVFGLEVYEAASGGGALGKKKRGASRVKSAAESRARAA